MSDLSPQEAATALANIGPGQWTYRILRLAGMPELQPGDVCFYSGTNVFSWLIRAKTYSYVSHCECIASDDQVLGVPMITASRDGKGVVRGYFRPNNLFSVVRPDRPFDIEKAMAWFATVEGQKYDWFGLLNFTSAKRQGRTNEKMFCSEFCVRFLRRGVVEPVNYYDADGIAPSELQKSVALPFLWRNPFYPANCRPLALD
jgi:hypothetical protein